jgi:hypothetical protein
MIKYSLTCKECDLIFDSWFANSKEYEKLKKNRMLNCYNCNSLKIEKSLMAPKLISRYSNSINAKETHKYEKIKKTITKYQKFIRNNFKYVGENFAHEARLIHYNEGKKKNIYGTATKKDLKELKEEGINTEIIPWINDNNN